MIMGSSQSHERTGPGVRTPGSDERGSTALSGTSTRVLNDLETINDLDPVALGLAWFVLDRGIPVNAYVDIPRSGGGAE